MSSLRTAHDPGVVGRLCVGNYSISNTVSSLATSLLNKLPFSFRASGSVVLLGEHYNLSESDSRDQFIRDFCSRILFTYRRDFKEPILPNPDNPSTVITSDAGWGCMIRVTQMAIAQSLVNLSLGREWRYPCISNSSKSIEESSHTYRKISQLFCDSLTAPFSLHRIVAEGEKLGRTPGTWFGPTSAAQAASNLFKNEDARHEIRKACGAEVGVCCFQEAAIYEDEVINALNESDAVILFVCSRIALETIEASHKAPILALFTLPFFQGIAGGGATTSAHYFIAGSEKHLYFLDPHIDVKPAFLSNTESQSFEAQSPCKSSKINAAAEENIQNNVVTQQQLNTSEPTSKTASFSSAPNTPLGQASPSNSVPSFFAQNYEDDFAGRTGLRAPKPLLLGWNALNPSLCLVFMIKSKEEWVGLKEFIKAKVGPDMIEILPTRPDYEKGALEKWGGNDGFDEDSADENSECENNHGKNECRSSEGSTNGNDNDGEFAC